MKSIVAKLGQVGSKGYYACAREAMRRAGVRFLATDIESGAGEGAGSRWGLSKPALSACAMEVLLVGFLNENLDYDGWSIGRLGMPDEAGLLRCSLGRLEREHNEGAVMLGHNTLGFDYSAMTTRNALLSEPQHLPWMFPSSPYRMWSAGLCDTMFLTSKSFRPGDGRSLSDWLSFWGRQEFGSGKEFGDTWRNGDEQVKELLCHYNRMNLIDSAMIALSAGALFTQDIPEGLGVDGGSVAVPFVASGYEPRPYPVLEKPLSMANADFAYVVPLTTPEAGLKENGPFGRGWAAYIKEKNLRPKNLDETIANFPFQDQYEGRTHPFFHRVIGYASVTKDGVKVVVNRDNEEAALTGFLDEAYRLRQVGSVYVPDRQDMLQLVIARASKLGLVLAPWVMDRRGNFWKDSKAFSPWKLGDADRGFNPNVLAFVRGWLPQPKVAIDKLTYEHDISVPPVWLEQESFEAEISAHLQVMFNYIASSPALKA
jgi:hypothetical protein